MSSLRRSADGVADQPGNAACTASIAARASSRVAAVALPTSSPLKVVQRRLRLADVERLLADTKRHLEQLERTSGDGFDRSLIPRVEWL